MGNRACPEIPKSSLTFRRGALYCRLVRPVFRVGRLIWCPPAALCAGRRDLGTNLKLRGSGCGAFWLRETRPCLPQSALPVYPNPAFSVLLQSIRELILRGRYRDVSLKHTLSCTKDHGQVFLAVRDGEPSRARNAMKRPIRAVKTAFASAAGSVPREEVRKEVHNISRTAPARWG